MNKQNRIIIIAVVTLIIFAITSLFLSQQQPINTPEEKALEQPTKTILKPDKLELQLHPLNGSNQSGKAVLTALPGGKTNVYLEVSEATTSAQPVHIQKGFCEQTKEFYGLLSSVKNGRSESIVEQSISELTGTPHSIIISASGNQLFTYTSCAEIKL